MIYVNHAAGSWPKPDSVQSAVAETMAAIPSGEGRADEWNGQPDPIETCRASLAELFHAPSPSHVILSPGATFSLNQAIDGLLRRGGRVVTTWTEHNSTLRPLYRLQRETGLHIEFIPCSREGRVEPGAILDAITAKTTAVVVSQAGNVTGTILDVEPIGQHCRKHGIPFVVDAAQSAGRLDIDVKRDNIDILVFSGHKGLMGPPGTGGMVLNSEHDLRPLIVGGTGIRSEAPEQPPSLPLLYEAGTRNLPGFAGLAAGVQEILREGIPSIQKRLRTLTLRFWDDLAGIPEILLLGGIPENRVAIQSLTFNGARLSDAAYILRESYGVVCRSGLHCAPLVHRALGTSGEGTLRISFGISNTESEAASVARAVAEIAKTLSEKGA